MDRPDQTPPSDDSRGTPFGRLPSLTHQIKELIHDYPEGIGIIKELLQNADDAGARSLRVIVDWRSHPTARLPAASMARLQGPALLFCNDAVFSDDDFDRIQEIYQSGKVRSAEQTGQFGKGFNTVYNVTDWPSFVTGGRVAFFDPHTSAVPDTTSVSPGRCWDLETCWKRYPDVLVPFLGAGLVKGQKDFRGTVFRLPLRTVEQARVSEIARRPFTVASWQELLDQVLATREELLLFLKNVEELHVSEFLANARELREILSVRTANADTVRAAREEVLGVLRGDAAGIAQRLARRSPFVVSYEHGFSWRSQSGSGGGGGAREESSTWRVVACLALDPEGQIAEAIDELLERDNKAVPLGGAAARIARSGGAGQSARQFGGRVYCSLPLPLETGIPVHLNGFFDLDSSRQALTVESGQTGTARVRVRWNQLLFRYVIAPAYARLIHDLSQDLGERDAEAYYALWPDTGGTLRRPFDTLATDVYKALTTLPVIRATGEKRWTSIRSVSIVPLAWPDLVEPLVAQGEALPEPALDARITAGFEVAEVRVRVWEPDRLRKLLRQDRSFAARPDEAPLACLRQRPWLESLLRFCLSDEARDLRGLPLALMADGVLRTFSHNAEVPIYLAGRQERAIFGSRPGWFVDEAFAESTGLGKIARLGLARMAPKEMLSRLQQLLPADATHLLRPEVTPAEFLNAGWLGLVFEYLTATVGRGFQPDRETLMSIPLVPDQDGRLRRPGYADTPLVVPSAGVERHVLRAFNVPLVTAPPPVEAALKAFAKVCPIGFVWEATGPDLVDTLAVIPETRLPPYSPQLYGSLLDFLARPDWRSGPSAYDDNRIEKLRSLPIYITTSGERVSLQGQVYLPADFRPASARSGAVLLSCGETGEWLAFLKALRVPTLNRYTFIENHLLPGYESLTPREQLAVLAWLRDNLQQAETEMERDGRAPSELRERVLGTALVRCEDGTLRHAPSVYHPASQVIRDLLGSSAAFPDMRLYSRGPDRWLGFFRDLGMAERPRARDLLAFVDRLAAEAGAANRGASRRAVLSIYEYLDAHWLDFRNEPIDDAGVTLAGALKGRAWLPAERNSQRLKRWPGATVPEDRLYRPGELYLPRQANLVASQKPIFPMPRENAQLREDLGFPDDPPVDLVLFHFDQLLALWGGMDSERPAHEAFETSLREIYRYIGLKAGRTDPRNGVGTLALETRYAGRPCLWHAGRLWKPEHAFEVAVPFFRGRRASIPVKAPLRQAYQLLGLRRRPVLNDYLIYLSELRAEEGMAPLPELEVTQLLTLYRHIAHEVTRHEGEVPAFPLLSQDGRLLDPEGVFLGDAPWFEDRLDAGRVPLLHRELPSIITHLPWVQSLAAAVKEVPRGSWQAVDDSVLRGRAERLQETLRSTEFRQGLARLMAHEHGNSQPRKLAWLGEASVITVQEILTDLYVQRDGTEDLVGSGTSDRYFDPARRRFYLAGGAGKLMRRYLAEMLNAASDDQALADLSGLVEILDCEPDEIERTLTQLRVKPLDTELEPETWSGDYGEATGTGPDEPMQPEAETAETSVSSEDWGDAGSTGEDQGRPTRDGEDLTATREADRAHETARSASQSVDDARRSPAAAAPVEVQRRNHLLDETKEATAELRGDKTARPAPQTAGLTSPSRGSAGSSPPRIQGERGPSGTMAEGDTGSGLVSAGGASTAQSSRTGEQPDSSQPPADGGGGTAQPVRMRPMRGRRPQGRGSRKDRVATYVSGSGPHPAGHSLPPSHEGEEERRQSIELGQKAVAKVCEFEERHGRRPTPLSHAHPGYDVESREPRVESTDPGTDSFRSIEVKGIAGPWTPQGVALSPRQFRAAQELGDRFWLYVVEYADDSTRAVVHPIQGPFARVTGYWFDRGWRQLADFSEAPSQQGRAEAGQRISIAGVGDGTISDVKQRGALRVLVIRLDDGRELKRAFNPRTMRVDQPGEGGDIAGSNAAGPH